MEPVATCTMPAGCMICATGMEWLEEYEPITATTPSSTKRLAHATEPSTVLALSQMESSTFLPSTSGCWSCATCTP